MEPTSNATYQSLSDLLTDTRQDIHDIRDALQTHALEISVLKEQLQQLIQSTADVIDVFDTMKGGIRFLGYLGKFLTWVLTIAASAWGIWDSVKR